MLSFGIRVGRHGRGHAFGLALLGGIACSTLAGSSAALAASGEVSSTQGIFQVPTAQCESLRDLSETSVDGPRVEGDVIVVCDGGDAGGRSVCEVVSGSTVGVSSGQGIGFCADRFSSAQVIEEGPLKEGVDVLATSFGSITGTFDSLTEETADSVCETFAPEGESVRGTKVCRRVVQDPEPPEMFPGCEMPPFIVTPTSAAANADACAIIASTLGDSVTQVDPDNLAFALFIDVDTLGQPGSEALFVCPGRRLECDGSLVGALVSVDYQIPKIVILEDPDCIRIRGRRVCGKR